MLLKLYQAGEPVLRKKAKTLTMAQLKSQKIQDLIELMIDTMRDYPGVGLAAPQVGEALRIIVIEDKKVYTKKLPAALLKEQGRRPVPLKIIVNPKVTVLGKNKAHFFEGCMSVPGYRAVIARRTSIEVTGLDREGKPLKIKANGWYARILQHEIDHLNGILYTDKMLAKTLMNEKTFTKKWTDADSQKIRESYL